MKFAKVLGCEYTKSWWKCLMELYKFSLRKSSNKLALRGLSPTNLVPKLDFFLLDIFLKDPWWSFEEEKMVFNFWFDQSKHILIVSFPYIMQKIIFLLNDLQQQKCQQQESPAIWHVPPIYVSYIKQLDSAEIVEIAKSVELALVFHWFTIIIIWSAHQTTYIWGLGYRWDP